ncbi:MAG: LuxR C-terminal-related transcriptional regulator [Phenylobacterium sp.]|nr:LuxR C-terminal-related transcriptional regulator [Phenylobacterium sp.]
MAGVVALQALAVTFFMLDAAADVAADGLSLHVAVETVAALGLLAGVVLGLLQLRGLLAAGRRKTAALAIAAGALSEVFEARAREWGLTPAEADVAIFALKGCEVAEIAELRNAAPGTVRAQLTRVYQKAGVNSRGALASLFLDELIIAPAPAAARRRIGLAAEH